MRLSGILLSVLSGLLLTAGFPKFDVWVAGWIALVPLLYALEGRSPRQAFGLGMICGMVHYLTTMYWIWYVLQHYGGLDSALAVGVLILLCAYLALYPAVFAVIARRWRSFPKLWVFGLPCLWVALEWIRAHALTGFPW